MGEPLPTRDATGNHTDECRCGACYDPYSAVEWLEAENKRLRDALVRARQQIVDQQAMPDPPTWIDDILKE